MGALDHRGSHRPLLDAHRLLRSHHSRARSRRRPPRSGGKGLNMLENLDLGKHLTKQEYERDLVRYQVQLRELAWQLYLRKRSLIIVFEGRDAAGKGGCIRRLTEKLDARGYEVFPIAAPEGEDKSHHYRSEERRVGKECR